MDSTMLLTTETEEARTLNETAVELSRLIKSSQATIAVIGLGYVGLPMAIEFSEAGMPVLGFDIDTERHDSISRGKSYVVDISDQALQAAVASGRFCVTTELDRLADADVILICVPTPLRKSKDPDLSAVIGAAEYVASRLRPGQLVILESTTYPGTTQEVLLPMFEARGLVSGQDFWLAFSPERVDPGNAHFSVKNITKLVGGCDNTGTVLARQFYEKIVDKVVPVTNPKVAETAKLLENTFRSVNIALANEMALICKHLDVDVWEVIDAAATKPFGFMPHYPGPGIGGHCIPLDPHYLSWKVRLDGYEPRFISLATEINGSMPKYVVGLIGDALNESSLAIRGSNILMLGMAYKPNVSDIRESPALEIAELLMQRGAKVEYCDPHVPDVTLHHTGQSLTSQTLTVDRVRASDCVVVATNHRLFDFEMVVANASSVVDTRNATRKYIGHGNIKFI